MSKKNTIYGLIVIKVYAEAEEIDANELELSDKFEKVIEDIEGTLYGNYPSFSFIVDDE